MTTDAHPGEADAAGPRLSPTGDYRFLQGLLGGLVFRPWFDVLALQVVAQWYLPLSRGWAAALAAEGSPERFLEALGGADLAAARLQPLLDGVAQRQAAYEAADRAWQVRFFDSASTGHAELVALEEARHTAAHKLMAARRTFVRIRNALPAARWEIARPAELAASRHAARLAGPEAAFPAPEIPPVEVSRRVAGPHGRDCWLRFRSPVMGDMAWARVTEPEGADDPPSVIYLHGIGMEADMWRGMASPVERLTDAGVRVISPEAPWHGRRRLPGYYGGEPAIGRGPIGLIELFEAGVAEVAVLVDWARKTSRGAVAIGGVSLGALTAQRAAAASCFWPEALRPEAMLLVATSGDLLALAERGSLVCRLGLDRRLEAAGWTAETLTPWLPLLEPEADPGVEAPIPPERMIMVLGSHDDLTPFAGGLALARAWDLPPDNLVVRRQGHFSTSLGLLRETGPLDRFAALLQDASARRLRDP